MKTIISAQAYHRPKWNIRKSNWPVYQENIVLQLIEKKTNPEFNPTQINKIINEFQQTITSAENKAFGAKPR